MCSTVSVPSSIAPEKASRTGSDIGSRSSARTASKAWRSPSRADTRTYRAMGARRDSVGPRQLFEAVMKCGDTRPRVRRPGTAEHRAKRRCGPPTACAVGPTSRSRVPRHRRGRKGQRRRPSSKGPGNRPEGHDAHAGPDQPDPRRVTPAPTCESRHLGAVGALPGPPATAQHESPHRRPLVGRSHRVVPVTRWATEKQSAPDHKAASSVHHLELRFL